MANVGEVIVARNAKVESTNQIDSVGNKHANAIQGIPSANSLSGVPPIASHPASPEIPPTRLPDAAGINAAQPLADTARADAKAVTAEQPAWVPNGGKSGTVLPDGTAIGKSVDGTMTATYPDGTIRTTAPNVEGSSTSQTVLSGGDYDPAG